MEFSILGETIRGKDSVDYIGFWMPSGGDEATGAIDVFVLSTSAAFTVKMQTKNTEDADPVVSSGIIGSASISSTGITKFDATAAEELVRYIIIAGGEVDDYMHFQLLPPQWAPN